MSDILGEIKLYNCGYVRLIGVFGSDEDVEKAARISYGKGTRKVSETRNLIRYLVRHFHTTPLESGVLRFNVKIPIFVMRQLIRHRSASTNEYSGRYSEMVDDFYVPSPEYLKPQAKTNKQGSEGELDRQTREFILGCMEDEFNVDYHVYQTLMNHGLSRELSRIVLPVANYTEAVWQINLHNFMHFLTLRTDSHAQQEIQDMANAMYDLAKPYFPLCFEAWEDYRKNARSLSSLEQRILSDILNGSISEEELCGSIHEKYGMSKRELNEFVTWYNSIKQR